jgi:translation initiation factor IF-3
VSTLQKPPQTAEMHRINHQIRIAQIRVIGPEGEQLGIMTPDEGRDIAQEAGLDLVEVAPKAIPPVCRIMDYGKFRYETSKKESKSKSARVELKTITLRPKTDTHDLETKLNQARKFIEGGDRVKFVMRMRGREASHLNMWIEKMNGIVRALADVSVSTSPPQLEGRTVTTTVEPTASKGH